MKIFRHRNIMGVIFSILALLPIFAVLGRTAYTVVNKNANQSYAGVNINDKQVNSINTIDYTTMYYFDSKIINQNTNTTGYQLLFQYQIVENDNYINTSNWDILSSDRCYVNNNSNLPIFYSGTTSYGQAASNMRIAFNFYLTTYNPINDDMHNYIKTIFKTIGTPSNESLDNAFEYSLSTFVDDNSFGNINFFTWFTDMFLSNNTHNNLYVHFANWYMNYIMLTSSAYILFLVLMWFINFARRLLERGMNYDF